MGQGCQQEWAFVVLCNRTVDQPTVEGKWISDRFSRAIWGTVSLPSISELRLRTVCQRVVEYGAIASGEPEESLRAFRRSIGHGSVREGDRWTWGELGGYDEESDGCSRYRNFRRQGISVHESRVTVMCFVIMMGGRLVRRVSLR